MKTMLGSGRHHYTKRVGIFLIAVALIAVIAGCGTTQYELTMAANPDEGGTAIDLTGESPYAAGTEVYIKAIANPGYRFVKWTAPAGAFDDEEAIETTFTMPVIPVTVTANFVAVYELTMTAEPDEGGTAVDLTGESPYAAGTEVYIKAEANPGYRLVKWTAPAGAFDDEKATETTFTMPGQSVAVTANFAVVYELTMTADPEEGGEAIDVAGLGAYPADAEVEIRAEANEGWAFTGWASDPEGIIDNEVEAETFLTMPAQNVTITANFILFAGGNGTAGNPYQIADWRNLDNIRNYLDAHFIVISDLDSHTTGYTELASPTANEGKGWQPVGNPTDPFEGSFDGQGYDIYDLFIDRPDESCVGLFGVLDIVGAVENVGVVNGNVTGDDNVAGLVGRNDGTVSNSCCTGDVTGNLNVGSLAGYNFFGTVTDSYSSGSVTGQSNVGGLVGWNRGPMSSSYSSGSVTGQSNVGGLTGKNSSTTSNSYATSSVTGDDNVGGLAGRNDNTGTVSNSYSTGSVTGNTHVGGLVGRNLGTVSNSFWDTETSGQASSSGGTGKTTEEMQDIDTFTAAGWDIVLIGDYVDETWYIDDGNDYPRLGWQF